MDVLCVLWEVRVLRGSRKCRPVSLEEQWEDMDVLNTIPPGYDSISSIARKPLTFYSFSPRGSV